MLCHAQVLWGHLMAALVPCAACSLLLYSVRDQGLRLAHRLSLAELLPGRTARLYAFSPDGCHLVGLAHIPRGRRLR